MHVKLKYVNNFAVGSSKYDCQDASNEDAESEVRDSDTESCGSESGTSMETEMQHPS
jgi:hypothetical protein